MFFVRQLHVVCSSSTAWNGKQRLCCCVLLLGRSGGTLERDRHKHTHNTLAQLCRTSGTATQLQCNNRQTAQLNQKPMTRRNITRHQLNQRAMYSDKLLISECDGGQLVFWPHRYELVASAQLAADVGRPSRQNERHEDAFAVLPAHDVEAQTAAALPQQNLASVSANKQIEKH